MDTEIVGGTLGDRETAVVSSELGKTVITTEVIGRLEAALKAEVVGGTRVDVETDCLLYTSDAADD